MANLFPLDLVRINESFRYNHWDYKGDYYFKGIYNLYCNRFGILDDNIQKDLILDLTKRYTLIRFNDYMSELMKLLDSVFKSGVCTNKIIFLFPIDGYEKDFLSKSGRFTSYAIIGHEIIMYCLNKYNKRINLINKIDGFKKIDDNSILLLIDDVIGSGTTLNECLEYIKDNMKIDDSIIKICSIAISKETKSNIQKRGFDVFCNRELKKEITDYYCGLTLQNNAKAMEKIEEKLQVDEGLHFGWGRSELLITLVRTPNDTFPYFWYNKKTGDMNAPFQRY